MQIIKTLPLGETERRVSWPMNRDPGRSLLPLNLLSLQVFRLQKDRLEGLPHIKSTVFVDSVNLLKKVFLSLSYWPLRITFLFPFSLPFRQQLYCLVEILWKYCGNMLLCPQPSLTHIWLLSNCVPVSLKLTNHLMTLHEYQREPGWSLLVVVKLSCLIVSSDTNVVPLEFGWDKGLDLEDHKKWPANGNLNGRNTH